MEPTAPSYCAIRAHRICHNGQLVYAHPCPTDTLEVFLVAAYRHLTLQYPKFFKMDTLCKLAFLTAEVLLTPARVGEWKPGGELGVVLSNKSSSLLTDLAHQRSIQDAAHYFPSPAVFVYTLPNIMIGELSIRHQLTGENTLFIADTFPPELLETYATELLAEGLSPACLCGWIEATEADYESFFYLVEPAVEAAVHPSAAAVQALYAPFL